MIRSRLVNVVAIVATVAALTIALASCGTGGERNGTVAADDISALLAGNTAEGQAGAQRFRQFFDADGTTIYSELGGRQSTGLWRVSEVADLYESKWGDNEWERWEIRRIDGVLHWIAEGVEPITFEMVEGQQLYPEG